MGPQDEIRRLNLGRDISLEPRAPQVNVTCGPEVDHTARGAVSEFFKFRSLGSSGRLRELGKESSLGRGWWESRGSGGRGYWGHRYLAKGDL